jgi:hypothetical protein
LNEISLKNPPSSLGHPLAIRQNPLTVLILHLTTPRIDQCLILIAKGEIVTQEMLDAVDVLVQVGHRGTQIKNMLIARPDPSTLHAIVVNVSPITIE